MNKRSLNKKAVKTKLESKEAKQERKRIADALAVKLLALPPGPQTEAGWAIRDWIKKGAK